MKHIVDSFFHQLFRGLFRITNPFTKVSEENWQCMEEYFKEISVFGDIPLKIVNQLKLPMTNSRQFVESLETLHDIFDKYLNITLRPECVNGLARMETCAVCNGIREKPCVGYCTNILTGCTHQILESEQVWRLTAETLIKVSKQLKSSQNFVRSFKPVPILVSEAIMHFQENRDIITNKMISKCLYMDFDIQYRLKRSIASSNSLMKPRKSEQLLIWNQMFDVFIQKMEGYKNFFGSIPSELCDSGSWATQDKNCWNGTDVGEYRLHVANVSEQARNPEFQLENFLSFRGEYIEERLRLQWLQSRLSHILSFKTETDDEITTPAFSASFVAYDDDDYADEYEGSAYHEDAPKRFSTMKSQIDIIIEPYPMTMCSSCGHVITSALHFLLFLCIFT
ncbi:unnamed protein product [Caenorhabditis bovis]|uniref:Glypican n=1 Tax=Caenorhabditis bovis TaxID=2654633 RepID=A0A8S1EJU2_9PELO|nr:unnamed protein product [Caenorhabditis bovis]